MRNRSNQELADHLDSLLRNQIYSGSIPQLVPIHSNTIQEIIRKLRKLPPLTQVEKSINGELGEKEDFGDLVG